MGSSPGLLLQPELNANPGAVPERCQSSLGSKAHGAALGLVFGDPTLSQGTPQHQPRSFAGYSFQKMGRGETLFCCSVHLIHIFTALPVLNPKQMVQLSPAPQSDDPWGLPAKCTFQRIIPRALLPLIWSLLSIPVLHPSSHSPALPHHSFHRGSLFHLKGWWSHRLLWSLNQRQL